MISNDADARGALGRLGSWWRSATRGGQAQEKTKDGAGPSASTSTTTPRAGAEAVGRARGVSVGGRDAGGGLGGLETTETAEAAVNVRHLDHARPSNEQEPWRCVALTTIAHALTLQEAITRRPGMEASVVALSAMQPREILRCRAEASKSRLLFARTAPLGGGGRGA